MGEAGHVKTLALIDQEVKSGANAEVVAAAQAARPVVAMHLKMVEGGTCHSRHGGRHHPRGQRRADCRGQRPLVRHCRACDSRRWCASGRSQHRVAPADPATERRRPLTPPSALRAATALAAFGAGAGVITAVMGWALLTGPAPIGDVGSLRQSPRAAASDGLAPSPPIEIRGPEGFRAPLVPVAAAPDGALKLPKSGRVGGWWALGAATGSAEGTTLIMRPCRHPARRNRSLRRAPHPATGSRNRSDGCQRARLSLCRHGPPNLRTGQPACRALHSRRPAPSGPGHLYWGLRPRQGWIRQLPRCVRRPCDGAPAARAAA